MNPQQDCFEYQQGQLVLRRVWRMEEDNVRDNSVIFHQKIPHNTQRNIYVHTHLSDQRNPPSHINWKWMHNIIVETNKAGFDLVSCRAVAFLQERDEGRAKLLQTTLPTHWTGRSSAVWPAISLFGSRKHRQAGRRQREEAQKASLVALCSLRQSNKKQRQQRTGHKAAQGFEPVTSY